MPSAPVVSHPFVVEGPRPLSRSKIWEIQRQLYLGQGVRAWREGGVPHFITSNSFAARSYARVTLAHLRGILAGSAAFRQRGARILELGAGTGRFAFHFLRHFLPMWRDSGLEGVPVTYVMTDMAQRNVDFWRTHPALAPFLEGGQLVLATCDAEDPADLKRVLEACAPAQRGGPLVAFANYVFDGLRPDLFLCEGGRLREGLVGLRAERPDIDPSNPLAAIALEVTPRDPDGAFSSNPVWNRILEGYRARGADAAVLFPAGAMSCLAGLRAQAPESLLVLATDEGSHSEDAVTSGELRFLANGAVALPEFPVNFHALGEYTTAHGGQAFFSNHELGGLCVAAFVWDETGRDAGATRQVFHEAIDLFGPAEYFLIVKSLERTGGELSCQEMLAHLRWSAWDAKILHLLLPNLAERLPTVTPPEMAAWAEALEQVWSLYYHLDPDEGDFAFGTGAALARAGQWRGALVFFERSLKVWGADGNTLCNLGVCHARLGDRKAALACVESALRATPDNPLALRMRGELLGPPLVVR
jgi:hypothetical protein